MEVYIFLVNLYPQIQNYIVLLQLNKDFTCYSVYSVYPRQVVTFLPPLLLCIVKMKYMKPNYCFISMDANMLSGRIHPDCLADFCKSISVMKKRGSILAV